MHRLVIFLVPLYCTQETRTKPEKAKKPKLDDDPRRLIILYYISCRSISNAVCGGFGAFEFQYYWIGSNCLLLRCYWLRSLSLHSQITF